MKDDGKPKVLVYGEDGFTLKYTRERLGEILHRLGDNSNPADCTVFYRPSLGRHGYGEFDAIIISQEIAYLVEAKWDGGRNLSRSRKQRPIRFEENQIRRHEIFEWFSQNWNGEEGEEWDRFADKNNPKFKRRFTFKNSKGDEVDKSIPSSDSLVGQNLQNTFREIGNRTLEDVLLTFYRVTPPEVKQDKSTTVFERYNPTHDLFTELE